MRKKEYYIFAGKLDCYGPLTLKGMVANAGCCVFDDCGPKSGPGGGRYVELSGFSNGMSFCGA